MTRSELITALSRKQPQLTEQDVELSVCLILDRLCDSLMQRERIEVRGFGTFDCRYRPARVGRNPKNGKRVEIPAKHVPHFKPGKEMRERINGSVSLNEQPSASQQS